jgi:regulator of protease activity HflC (stomatin/prohibitin superfamily)
MRERPVATLPGAVFLALFFAALAGGIYLIATAALHISDQQAAAAYLGTAPPPASQDIGAIVGGTLLILAAFFTLRGLFIVNPNEARVLQLFGKYVGTARDQGLRWTNPFRSRTPITLRVRSFETAKIKVNDIEGNPIEIGAIIVWKVVDSAQAVFEVESYDRFVNVQAEAAVRNLSTRYPYDAHDDTHLSLRGHTDAIAEQLKKEVQGKVDIAGVAIVEARIAHLAYAPEIAQAMLQRQQAGAIIAARQRIVEGAVGMVEMALGLLAKNKVVELDEERKAQMVSNLLVVLCGERGTQPVVNTGTIYQ